MVDAAASGHIVAQLAAPWTISGLVQVGLVRDQTRSMTEILADPAQTGVVVVTTPEELPVLETLELLDRLATAVPVQTAAVVVNRVLPELFTRDEESVFDRLRQPAALDQLTASTSGDVVRVLDAAAARGGPAARTGRRTSRSSRPGSRATCRCCSCPSSSPAATASGP